MVSQLVTLRAKYFLLYLARCICINMELTKGSLFMKKIIFILLLSSVFLTTSANLVFADTAKTKFSQNQMTIINVNTASLAQLALLPGVGKKKAAAIMEYRTKNGNFKSVDDLVNVKGIGQKMLQKLKGQVKTS
jgi:competence protein ComEA